MRISLIIFFLAIIQSGCNNSAEQVSNSAEDLLTIRLLPDEIFQEIHHFGASDCWSTQFVGKNWPVAKREKIADLLFSTDINSDRSPKGIGLSVWRFNIGAGSADQGDESGIVDEWRRAPGFLTNEGGYNWDNQAGQRWFLRAAKKRGVENFIGFVNSPPVQWTKNGKAFSSGGKAANIAESKYVHYANYLADVISNIKRIDQVELRYISPFNEPQWDWSDGGQEGTPWLNTEISAFTKILNRLFEDQGIDTHIDITEAGQINYLYENGNRSGRGDQINTFFNKNSDNFVGDLSHISGNISGHSYYTTYNNRQLIDSRRKLRQKLSSVEPALNFWMSEYCLLENNPLIQGGRRDLGIGPALYMARVIHTDLTEAYSSSWQWWLAVSPYDYKDGLLYIDYNKNDGQIHESKMLWSLGHFSRFIRPGANRIGIWRSDDIAVEQSLDGLLVSGYKNLSGNIVAVLVNQEDRSIPVRLEVQGFEISSIDGYKTTRIQDANMSFFEVNPREDKVIEISAKSIVTLVVK